MRLAPLLAVGLLLCAAPAIAQPVPDPAPEGSPPAADPDPDALLDEGRRRFTDEDDFDGARELFERSYQARPSWQALNGIALTWQKQARWVRALETYERLRAEFGASLAAKQLETVDRRIADLGRRVAVLTIEVSQPGAAISVDGEPVGQGPYRGELRLDPGGHLLAVSLADHRPFTERLTLSRGEHARRQVELVPVGVKLVVVPPPPVATRRRFATWIPWVTIGGGALLLTAGGLFDLQAQRDFDRFDALVAEASGGMPEPAEVSEGPLRTGERKRAAAAALYLAGGVTIGTGAALYLLNRPQPVESRPPRARLGVGPGSAQLSIHF